MQPTHLNRKDDTLALPLAWCCVEMSISGTFVTNVLLMDYIEYVIEDFEQGLNV